MTCAGGYEVAQVFSVRRFARGIAMAWDSSAPAALSWGGGRVMRDGGSGRGCAAALGGGRTGVGVGVSWR
ncbi:MAG: hypothetical protein ABI877_10065 [Gemmatimonadaceae bacterium]